MAKKAKAKRRVIVPTWIVRNCDSSYRQFVGLRPPLLYKWLGTWGMPRRGSALHERGVVLPTADHEASTPKTLHLKPGGGPIKVRLVRA